jgi:membrane protein implicated in regulation of membrane protease activity
MLKMNKSNNINIFLEVFWLILGIITLFIGVVITIKTGFREAYMFYIMSALSFTIYFARRWVRKNLNSPK